MLIRLVPRHLALSALALIAALAGFLGLIGPAVGSERIHSYNVTIVLNGDNSVRVREVIDWDFGRSSRHGIFREIPIDLGIPSDVTVSSPDAPAGFTASLIGSEYKLKIGDPATTITGRHRYIVSYTLSYALDNGRFAIDAIGGEFTVPIEHATVSLLGATISNSACFTGRYGSHDRCKISASGDIYRVEINDLEAQQAITVQGTRGERKPATMEAPAPLEGRDSSLRFIWAAILGALSLVISAATFFYCLFIGRNEVAGEGATEAAFGPNSPIEFGHATPVPTTAPPGLSRKVTDPKMKDLAGIEFVPPKGIEPWQGALVLLETVNDRVVGSWFSSLAASGIVEIDASGETKLIRPGPNAALADSTTSSILNTAFAGSGVIGLGSYNPSFAAAWASTRSLLSGWAHGSGMFERRPPSAGLSMRWQGSAGLVVALIFIGGNVIGGLSSGFLRSWLAAPLVISVTWLVAYLLYRPLTRALSVRGSALAIRTESFRRFLHDSEAEHVDWAWNNGLLREYSAWAVALNEADAWNSALLASGVPREEMGHMNGIMMPALYASSFDTTRQAPSSSGGGGGGFSGGGFSGGGGGGGGGGSW